MNPVIHAQLRDFAKANSITAESQEKQFEIYAIFSILSGLLGEAIDPYDAHLDGDEFGVDGIAVIIQGELVRDRQEANEKLAAVNNPTVEFIFFQAKTSTSYDYGDISKFFDAVTGFFDSELKGESDAVDDLIGVMEAVYDKGVGKRNPKISCYYITTGNYEEPSRIEKLKSSFIVDLEEKNIFDASTMTVRIEFLWRNQKIENRDKTFRYYILAGIGLHMTRAVNVFGMKKAKLAATAEAIIKLCKDEESLKTAVINVVSIVEERLKEIGTTTQERVRDTIRSETFSATFKERLLAKDIQSA